jgi:tetratricopeptide (TPR) repeat protein
MRRLLRSRCAALLALACAACDRPALPGVPSLSDRELLALEPAVRAQLAEALRSARERPRDAEASLELGLRLEAYDRYDAALECYRRATALAPERARGWHCRGRLEGRLGEIGPALSHLEEALRAGAEDRLAIELLRGELLLKSGDAAAAEAAFRRAAEAGPKSAHAALGIARALDRRGAPAEARASLERALALAPDFDEALYALALLERRLGDLAAAQRLLDRRAAAARAIEAPDPIRDAVRERRVDADEAFRAASARFRERDYEGALRLFEESRRRSPELALADYNIGLTLQRLGRHREAAERYRAFLARRPEHLDAWINLGNAHFELRRDAEAAECYARALALAPGDPRAHSNVALLHLRSGRAAEAIESFAAVLRARPDDRRAHAFLLEAVGGAKGEKDGSAAGRVAAFLRQRGLREAAVAALRLGVERSSGEWRDRVALAWMLATARVPGQRRAEEALEILEPLCRDAAAGDPQALDALGAAYAALGRFEDAERAALEALRLLDAGADDESRAARRESVAARVELYRSRRLYLED